MNNKGKMERHKKLLQVINAQGMLPVKTLAALLAVSEMTIRRDFEELQYKESDSTNVNFDAVDGNYSLLSSVQKAYHQKERIGQFAASLIDYNDTIIIDTGSTTARMLSHIPIDRNLTIVCYNANVMLELHKKTGFQLFMCGGLYHENTEMFESPESILFIERMRANKMLISAAGIHEQMGITCANAYEVLTKQVAIKSSLEKILMVDSSKFGQVRSAYFCDFNEIDVIVTDTELSDEWKSFIKSKDITLYLV